MWLAGLSLYAIAAVADAAIFLRDEARAVFPATVVPRDFDTIEIPFAERGEPALIRWNERMAEQAAASAS